MKVYLSRNGKDMVRILIYLVDGRESREDITICKRQVDSEIVHLVLWKLRQHHPE